jgi:RHS repeat-associated protein
VDDVHSTVHDHADTMPLTECSRRPPAYPFPVERLLEAARQRIADGFQYGRVLYTHGPGIDAPLSLIRMDYSDSIRTPQLVVLHNDWRGAYDIGSYAGRHAREAVRAHHPSSNFQTITSGGSLSDYPKAPGPQNTSWYHCVEVEWPAPHVWVTRDTRNRSINGPLAWMGTLIDGMRDNSGQMYMRNRYYDPGSGRFTQEDPIGLAGGLNAYGFARCKWKPVNASPIRVIRASLRISPGCAACSTHRVDPRILVSRRMPTVSGADWLPIQASGVPTALRGRNDNPKSHACYRRSERSVCQHELPSVAWHFPVRPGESGHPGGFGARGLAAPIRVHPRGRPRRP